MNEAAQKRTGGQHHRAGGDRAAVGEAHAGDAAVLDDEIVGFGFDDGEIGHCAQLMLHRLSVELAVGLRARAAHRRTFAAVENAELDAAGVRHPTHQAVQGVDFAHQMAFAEPADGRIARHGADGRELVGHQRGFGAQARSRGRGFTAGMAAANHDNVETRIHRKYPWMRRF